MITALVHLPDDDLQALGATLSALVTGVAQGVVADAVVIATAPSPDVAAIADATGAALVTARGQPWHAGADAARHEWLLCLSAGDVLLDDWPRALERFRARAAGRIGAGAVLGRLARMPERPLDWLARPLARFAPGPRAGDLAHLSHLSPGARPRIERLSVRIVRERSTGS